jgi:hypothetical protein
MNVPGFTGIRLHSDNSVVNTDGCVLVGMSKAIGKVLGSIDVVTTIIELMDKAITSGQSITIEVR